MEVTDESDGVDRADCRVTELTVAQTLQPLLLRSSVSMVAD